MDEAKPPERIWLLDYGHEDCTWCDDPSPSGEDHSAVEYVRVGAAPVMGEVERMIADLGEDHYDDRDGSRVRKGFDELCRERRQAATLLASEHARAERAEALLAEARAEEREHILDLLHREFPYPTEACAIIRADAIRALTERPDQ